MQVRLNDSIRQLREELQQLTNQTSISELTGTIQSIKEENKALRAQIAKVKQGESPPKRNTDEKAD